MCVRVFAFQIMTSLRFVLFPALREIRVRVVDVLFDTHKANRVLQLFKQRQPFEMSASQGRLAFTWILYLLLHVMTTNASCSRLEYVFVSFQCLVLYVCSTHQYGYSTYLSVTTIGHSWSPFGDAKVAVVSLLYGAGDGSCRGRQSSSLVVVEVFACVSFYPVLTYKISGLKKKERRKKDKMGGDRRRRRKRKNRLTQNSGSLVLLGVFFFVWFFSPEKGSPALEVSDVPSRWGPSVLSGFPLIWAVFFESKIT